MRKILVCILTLHVTLLRLYIWWSAFFILLFASPPYRKHINWLPAPLPRMYMYVLSYSVGFSIFFMHPPSPLWKIMISKNSASRRGEMARTKCLALFFSKSERNERNVLPFFFQKVKIAPLRGSRCDGDDKCKSRFLLHLAQLSRT